LRLGATPGVVNGSSAVMASMCMYSPRTKSGGSVYEKEKMHAEATTPLQVREVRVREARARARERLRRT